MGRNTTLKEAGLHRYIVNDDFSINAWWKTDAEDAPPWLYQPDQTDGTPWSSAEQAEQWFIAEYATPTLQETIEEVQEPIE